ncbi:hypothetical protein RND71_015432 [Anisodus tanguticus]|uniref:BHLH domain-containing protein n=1 Tax=Anisodus tanguticus TaxID=243964 RepID=A0AAE1VKA8_9SOLA|nr:hypothetical protein RND71_015432 [Anisodus tanguticus]
MESGQRSKSVKAGPKLERKYVEKNRRIYMKKLINQLYSMLPAHASTSKETIAMPDQVVAAEEYIKSLVMKLEKKNKLLEELKMGTKRAQSLNATNEPSPSTKSTPQIEFHEMGPYMFVVLMTDLDNIATFNNIIRLCHEEGVEVVSANFSLNGNSTIQISYETKVQINRSSTMEFRATTLCDKIKELIYGPSCSNNMESELYLWDYVIESGLIEFNALELSPIASPNPDIHSYMQNVDENPSSLWNWK